ncbi:MAG: hypothetical protein MJ215_04180, partial [Spirochaetia bacterium]|nr:hypothetical protein [Spirochaetia bacterium]
GIVRAFDSLMEENPELAEQYRQQQETQETKQAAATLDIAGIRGKIPSVSPDVLRALEPLGEGQTATIKSRALEGEVQYEIGKIGKKGHGLLHIIEQRMVKDGRSLDEAVDVAIAVAESVADGELVKEEQNTRHLDKNGIRAIVAINDKNKNVITGYEVKEDESSDANRRSETYAPEPHVRSEQVVASLKRRLHQLNQSVNQIRFQLIGELGATALDRAAVAPGADSGFQGVVRRLGE